MGLAEHGAEAAHLPHQPLHHLETPVDIRGHQATGLFGQIDEDGTGFHQANAGIMIDDRRDFVIGAYGQEVFRELLIRHDVDRLDGVGQSEFLERDRRLASVWRRPSVEIDHDRPFLTVGGSIFGQVPARATP